MLPPSDSFQHQELKLAEALSNIQAIEVPPPPPPPSYTLMPVTSNESFHAYGTDDEDDDDCVTPLAPITLHIDASIRIDGQANTIILPPPTTTTTTTTTNSAFSPQSSSTAQAGHALAERLTHTILTALKDAGVVGYGRGGTFSERRAQRPLELHVNASVNVNGEKNVICAGVPREGRVGGSSSGSGRGNGSGSGSGSGTGTGTGTGTGLQDPGNLFEGKEGTRKRRAESVSRYACMGCILFRERTLLTIFGAQEPVETQKMKKGCL
jgi:hypothetical protein